MRQILIITIFAISFFISNIYAAEVTLDETKSYGPGDIVELSGVIEDGVEGDFVAIEVKSPSGETILIRTVTLGPGGSYYLKFKIPQSAEAGEYNIAVNTESEDVTIQESKSEVQTSTNAENGGGCLIVTATFGSELAPQVQFLREIRDNTVMSTQLGTSFMTAFNAFYYSFSPTVADLERQNPIFKEMVKLFITPMLSTLNILTLAEEGSEPQVLGLGIFVIVLNLGMYVAAPTTLIWQIKKRL